MQAILSFLNPELSADKIILDDFSSRIIFHEYKKGECLYRPGDRCNHLYFVLQGLVRASYFKEGKDISCHFTKEGEVCTAIDAFFQRSKTQYQLEFLEEGHVAGISHSDLHELFDLYPRFGKFGRELVIHEYGILVERVNSIQFFTAKERYDRFMADNADLFQRVSLGHIASFLGISQETLSRIRAKV